MEKTVDQKLQECRTVIIQNVEKSMQKTMVFRYLKEERIDTDVKTYSLNSKDGFITFEFQDHEKARQYYDKANFKDKILIRPFNIYFNLQLSDAEMKKYYFEGINEDNMRKMFEIARKVGICKIYTSYTTPTSQGRIKPNGVLSFIRKDEINQKEFESLKNELLTIGIKISPYHPDRGLKCSVVFSNFYKGDINGKEDVIQKQAKEQATKMINAIVKDPNTISNVSAIVKRREIPDKDQKDGSKFVTKVTALIEFVNSESAIDHFESIRLAFLKEKEANATLFFHSAETNSYISLITSGLNKPEEMSVKQFENKLVECFRHVNKDVVQVNVFPAYKTYVGRVYLRNEEAGKSFVVDFPSKRDFLVDYYKDVNNIKFNMNVDQKTIKKIKTMQKKNNQIIGGIKNQGDNIRKNRPNNQNPLYMGGLAMPNIPSMGMHGMGGAGMGPIITGPVMGGPGMGGPMMGGPMMGGSGMTMPQHKGMSQIGMPTGSMNIQMLPHAMVTKTPNADRAKIKKFVEDKAQIVALASKDQKSQKSIKTSLFSLITLVLEQDLKVPNNQSRIQADQILKKNDVGTILDFLQSPDTMYSKVYKN